MQVAQMSSEQLVRQCYRGVILIPQGFVDIADKIFPPDGGGSFRRLEGLL
jgi:hypothetical protein